MASIRKPNTPPTGSCNHGCHWNWEPRMIICTTIINICIMMVSVPTERGDNKAINIGNRWNRGGAQIWANGQHHTQGYKTSPLNKNKSRKENWVGIISHRKIKPSLTNFLMVTIHLRVIKITFWSNDCCSWWCSHL